MGKRYLLLTVILVLLLSTGCQFAPATTPQEATFSLSDSEIATLSALSTQVNKTPEIALPSVTPTSTNGGEGSGSLTATPLPGSIAINNIVEKSPDAALISWNVNGDFPSGFRVVWTDQQGSPTFPENNSILVGSSTARSAIINVTPGTIYYVRVCRFLYDACDIYSDLGIFAFNPPTSTPDLGPMQTATAVSQIKTATAAVSTSSNGTASSGDSSLVITLIKGGTTGKAYMAWTDHLSSSKGYRIIYSTTSSTPTFGTDSSYIVSDPNARSAYVDGSNNTTYYYRICRFVSSGCNSYSPTYTFTFPSDSSVISISGIANTSLGVAQVSWTASGSFPDGFKILYSKTTALPTLSDSVIAVSDGELRLGSITGDPSGVYHVRVCKYSGSACTIYSSVTDFTFAADPAVITITGIADSSLGTAQVDWTASGSFPSGFKILYSKTTALPTLSDSVVTVSDGALRLGSITGDPSGVYHVRVCKYSGSACTIYSAATDFTFAADPAVITITGLKDNATVGSIDLTWTASGVFPNGFMLLYSTTEATPTYENSSHAAVANGALRTGTITAVEDTHYYLRICKYNGSTCAVYSTTIEQFTTAKTGIVLASDPTLPLDPTAFIWTLTPDVDHTDGYRLFWADDDQMAPAWPTANTITFAAAARGGSIPGLATNSLVRLCFWDAAGSTCGSYSNTLKVIFIAP